MGTLKTKTINKNKKNKKKEKEWAGRCYWYYLDSIFVVIIWDFFFFERFNELVLLGF